jgi:serine/threonine protein kinase
MLVDFGTVSVTGQSGTRQVTFREGPYRAPDEMHGEAVQPASDVYALGVVLYKALTGDLLWPVDPADERGEMRFPYREPRRLPEIDGMPPQVAKICSRCLAINPRSRPSSSEVARDLATAANPARDRRRST